MKVFRYICVGLCMGIAASCGYDSFPEHAPDPLPSVIPDMDMARLRAMCSEGVANVTDSIVIGGYVTANDKSGNIYRSFFLEDNTGAVEVRAGMYSLHNVYVRGISVV